MEDLEPQDANEDDELEAEIMRADHAFASESVGTTAEEALEGETLDQRLAEERPERPGTDEVLSVVDEGPSDDEEELVGDAVVERDEFASPEEAAVTERDRAPGATTTPILIRTDLSITRSGREPLACQTPRVARRWPHGNGSERRRLGR